MKKTFSILLCLLIVAIVAGCSNQAKGSSSSTPPSDTSSSQSPETSSSQEETPEPKELTVTGTVTDAAMNSLMLTLEDGSTMEFVTTDADTSELADGLVLDMRVTVTYLEPEEGSDLQTLTAVKLSSAE